MDEHEARRAEEPARTYFHLPDTAEYDTIHRAGSGATGLTVPWFVPLSVGDEVTIHSRFERYRVARKQFHKGHPDELPGLHVFLELLP